jgi:ribosomal-protein-alanine N-acetyltransferase
MTVRDLVKLTYFFVDELPPDERAEIVGRHFGDHRPATTLTYVPRLAAPAIKVEVEGWAAADAG